MQELSLLLLSEGYFVIECLWLFGSSLFDELLVMDQLCVA